MTWSRRSVWKGNLNGSFPIVILENTGVFWLFRLDVSSLSFQMAYLTFIIDFYCTQFHGYTL